MNLSFGGRAFRVLEFLCILGLFLFSSDCGYYLRTNKTLDTFSRIEKEGSKYGTVSVGAVRVADYDNSKLESARDKFRKALEKIRDKLIERIWESISPEGFIRRITQTEGKLVIEYGRGTLRSSDAEGAKNLPESTDKVIGDRMPEPNRIDMIGLRMAELKFIETEFEDLNLDSMSPVDTDYYRRMMVSLDFTAWVRGQAGAVLVYVDLYPFDADGWCHEAAKILEEQSRIARKFGRDIEGSEYEREWMEILADLHAFESTTGLKPWRIKKEGLEDPVARCHAWLRGNRLLPRLIHVERIGKAEYLVSEETDYLRLEYGIGAQLPGLLARIGGATDEQIEQLKASIRPLSLGFAAGDQRAGWLFMPSKIEEGKMPPTERRLKMVVDIPRNLSKLAIHIHKLFLGPDLEILSDGDFAKQMANLNLARWMLNQIEEEYEGAYKEAKELRSKSLKDIPKYYTSPSNWRLAKSRMRNLLYQGWSEEIVVDIPPSNMNHEKR